MPRECGKHKYCVEGPTFEQEEFVTSNALPRKICDLDECLHAHKAPDVWLV